MSDWIDGLERLCKARATGVLVTVLEADGSTPRDSGTKMLVTNKGIDGTIGGGTLEFRAIGIAREMLAAPAAAAPRVERFPLGPSLGQCCGGSTRLMFERLDADANVSWIAALAAVRRESRPAVLVTALGDGDGERGGKLLVTAEAENGVMFGELTETATTTARALLADGAAVPARRETAVSDLLFEPILPDDFHIVLFGAGHVGRALVAVLAGLPCRVVWVDSREDVLPNSLPANVSAVLSGAPEFEVEDAPAGSYFLVMTHSHGLDFRIGERILRRGDFRYFGLIGSATKRKRFEQTLRRKGLGDEAIARLTCPIGAAGIPGKRPGEIAVAVAAELLQVRARTEVEDGERVSVAVGAE